MSKEYYHVGLVEEKQQAVVVGGSGGFERVLKVTVLEINAGTVRLGFEVDKEIPVHRLEVWEKIHANARPNSSMDGPSASFT